MQITSATMQITSATALLATSACWRAPPTITMKMPDWVPAARIAEISEPAAQAAFSNMQTAELTLPSAVSTAPVAVRYLKTNVEPSSDLPPMLLVHGFDISSLEYRRLLPQLEAMGIEAYAPCIAGWGFTETTTLKTVGTDGKRAQLLAFHEQVLGGRPACWVGASLGACIALDCYLAQPSAFQSLACLAPGFFTPPPPVVPAPIGRLLLQNVLSSPGVRESIAKQAYSVKEDQTEDAIRCGNLHLNRREWEDDSLTWLLSGAYGDQSGVVPKLSGNVEVLTLWGREDEVIPPAGLGAWPAARLMQALPSSTFRWVDGSGHTPHLEQPVVTATALNAFVRGQPVPGDADVSDVLKQAETYDKVKETAGAVAAKAREALGEAFEKAKEAVAEQTK